MNSRTADETTESNRKAWNAKRFDAWTSAFGGAEAEAARIVSDPDRTVRRISPYIGNIKGRRICHVQGSHGRMAVALALLGADVHVIDFSDENCRFALDLAAAANVSISYSVCDVMNAGGLGVSCGFDVLLLELGVLHYHQDLEGLLAVLRGLVADDGTLLLNEFHPTQRKLFWPDGPKDYFQHDLVEADVPNPDVSGGSLGKCRYRFWTMGEVITAVVKSGFRVSRLDEHPDWSDPTIPGTFTLLALA